MFFQLAKKGSNSLSAYLITIIAVFAAYFLGQLPMGIVIYMTIVHDDSLGPEELEEFLANPDFASLGIDSNFGFFLLILMFVLAILALLWMLRIVHHKRFRDMITPDKKVNWNKILFAFGFWIVLGFIFEGISYFLNPDAYVFQFSPGSFIILLIISLFLLPVQTSFEEIFFRGYLMQGFGILFRNKYMPLLVTSLLFALIHGLNPEIEKFGRFPMMSYYILAGLILGIMTIMDDSLELALGVHAAVNVYGALFVGYEGSAIQTDSLWKTTYLDPWLMFFALFLMGLIFLTVCARRYQWPSFARLFEKIQFQPENSESE